MASVESYKGRLYLKYYDRVKRYTKRKALHLKDNQPNRRLAAKEAKNFNADFTDTNFFNLNDLTHSLTLTQGKEQFVLYKNFKPHTRTLYDYAVKHLLEARGEKFIINYTHKDYIHLLSHFRTKNLSQNSQSIYTRVLHSLFNYFVKQKMIKENIIDRIPTLEKIPRPIPLDELHKLLGKLETKENYYHQYALIYLLVNTGIRISTAIALRWEDIDWQNKLIIFKNVKVRGTEYVIPLIPRFEKIFTKLGIKQKGSIFPYSHKDSVRFLRRAQTELQFTQHYSVHKLKHTFISEMVKKGISLEILSEITNTSLRTLRKHYMHLDRKFIFDQLEKNEVA